MYQNQYEQQMNMQNPQMMGQYSQSGMYPSQMGNLSPRV